VHREGDQDIEEVIAVSAARMCFCRLPVQLRDTSRPPPWRDALWTRLDVAGIALRGDRKIVAKVTAGLRLHPC
jgi:hypothetical protein